jgi:hypothetical protein
MKRPLSKVARTLVPDWLRAAAKTRGTRRYHRPSPLTPTNGISNETGETLTASFDGTTLMVPAAAKADVEAIVNEPPSIEFTIETLDQVCARERVAPPRA